jgi:hypothetical protein
LHEREDNVTCTCIKQSRTFRSVSSAWQVVVALEWQARTMTQALQLLRSSEKPTLRVTVDSHCLADFVGRSSTKFVVADCLLKLGFVLDIALLGKDGVTIVQENLPHIFFGTHEVRSTSNASRLQPAKSGISISISPSGDGDGSSDGEGIRALASAKPRVRCRKGPVAPTDACSGKP